MDPVSFVWVNLFYHNFCIELLTSFPFHDLCFFLFLPSRDGASVDFSILTKHLIPKDEVVGETDQVWTKDFLMHEVTKYFNEIGMTGT